LEALKKRLVVEADSGVREEIEDVITAL